MSETAVTADWRTDRVAAAARRPDMRLFVADADRAAAEAALTAALAVTPLDAATRPIAVVFPGAPERDAMLASGVPVTEGWMADVVATLPDALLAAPARTATVPIDGVPHLTIFAGGAPGTVASAELLSHMIGSANPTSADELDPMTIAGGDLERWQRPATPAQAPAMDPEGPSDARWLWLVALGLLAIESVLRRRVDRARAAEDAEVAHARVA
jgi:hypothetical protein